MFSTERFRQVIAGVSLIGFPLTLLVEQVVNPLGSVGGAAETLDKADQHGGPLVLAAVLLIASSAFLVPAAFALAHLIGGRGSGLVHSGLFFAILGALGHVAAATYYLIVSTFPGGQQAEMIAALERIDTSGQTAIVLPLILSYAVGILVLSFAAWRSGLAPVLVPVAIFAAIVLEAVPSLFEAQGVVKQTLVLASFGWLGLRVLAMGSAAWAAPSNSYAAPHVQAPRVPTTVTS